MTTNPTVEETIATIIDDLNTEDTYAPVYTEAGGIATSAPARAILDQFVVIPRATPQNGSQDPLHALLVSLIPAPRVSEHVADWPEDERDLHRNGDYRSFTDRTEQMALYRRHKIADTIIAALKTINTTEPV